MTYTPDGRHVITGGSNSAIRIYTVGQDGEPKTIDEGVDGHLGIGATVCLYINLQCETNMLLRMNRLLWVRRTGRSGNTKRSQAKWKSYLYDALYQ